MTTITSTPTVTDRNEWIYAQQFWCRKCGTEWHLNRTDKAAPLWRWFLGWLPRPKTEVQGPGLDMVTMYYVKWYPAESGVTGSFLHARCPTCGRTAMVRAPRHVDPY